jgi:hypothetical protein
MIKKIKLLFTLLALPLLTSTLIYTVSSTILVEDLIDELYSAIDTNNFERIKTLIEDEHVALNQLHQGTYPFTYALLAYINRNFTHPEALIYLAIKGASIDSNEVEPLKAEINNKQALKLLTQLKKAQDEWYATDKAAAFNRIIDSLYPASPSSFNRNELKNAIVETFSTDFEMVDAPSTDDEVIDMDIDEDLKDWEVIAPDEELSKELEEWEFVKHPNELDEWELIDPIKEEETEFEDISLD